MNLRQAKAADLKVEADIHCLATSGSLAQLMDRLAKHYVSVSCQSEKVDNERMQRGFES